MKYILRILLSSWLGVTASSALGENELPALGDTTSGLISLQQEHELGRGWLRNMRSQVSTVDDPLILEWFHDLVYQLVPNSQLQNTDLELIVVDSPELNAFAVPGGVVGINFGLLLYAEDEDQLASVLAHELAHLSQRHFARQVEAAQRRDPVALATLLASIILIATSNTDAGIAGIVGSQAASIQDQLAYSRDFEREADRLGMKTLAASGLDANAMTGMFTNMMDASRYRGSSLEFLMTHPLTATRVADAAGRAAQYPRKPHTDSFRFTSLKLIAEARYRLQDQTEKEFNYRLNKATGTYRDALLFSMARLALAEEQWNKGLNLLSEVKQNQLLVSILNTQLIAGRDGANAALNTLRELRRIHTDSPILDLTLAEISLQAGKNKEATLLLKHLTEDFPTTPLYWQRLSKAAQASGDVTLAYRALGEHHHYSGRTEEAVQQLQSAIREAIRIKDFQREAAIRERLKVIDPDSRYSHERRR